MTQGLKTQALAEGENRKGIYSTNLPPDFDLLQQIVQLLQDNKVQTGDVVTFATRDPIITMDILRISNALLNNETREQITCVQSAFVRLGSQQALVELESLFQRSPVEDETSRRYLEIHRRRGRHTGVVARAIAECLVPSLAADAQSAGLLSCVGDMLAAILYGSEFAAMGDRIALASLRYKLSSKFNYDTEKVRNKYLRSYGIPQRLISALDEEASFSEASKAVLRPICSAAQELVAAEEAERWEKYQPDRQLPPKSPLRLLNIPGPKYELLFSKLCEYFINEKKKRLR